MSFYAVANGRNIGIFNSWNECSESVKGFPKAKYKKFKTTEECKTFIDSYNESVSQSQSQSQSQYETTEPILQETSDFVADYYVYTDGACSNNGKSNACAGMGVFFGDNHPRNVSKKIEGKQTNNTAEISAFIEACNIIQEDVARGKKVTIMTDSKYVMLCVTTYGEKCAKQYWQQDIPNKDLVKQAYECMQCQSNIHVHHVRAHTNKTDVHSYGNDQADKLANEAIGLENCPYAASSKPPKIYLNVAFTEKEDVKQLGGKWDPRSKKWFTYENNPKISVILAKYSSE